MRILATSALALFVGAVAACGGTPKTPATPAAPAPETAAAEQPAASEGGEQAVAWLPGKWVWFELVTGDIASARSFYGELFAWSFEDVPMGDFVYTMAKLGDRPVAGLMPMPAEAKAAAGDKLHSHWMPYVSVDDVDAAAAKVAELGGAVMRPAADIGQGVGRMAMVKDPQGAHFTLFRGTAGDPPDGAMPQPGEFIWPELWTTDDTAAAGFYTALLGYGLQTMPMPAGPYHVMMTGEASRAGIQKSPMPDAHPAWLLYVTVADCDASVAKATQLGAELMAPAVDVPNVGRFAVLRDPAGAAIAVLQPAPMPEAAAPSDGG